MSEYHEQAALVHWFGLQYKELKHLLIASENGAHIAGNKAQRAIKVNKSKRAGMRPGVPDLFLACPNLDHHGLFIEMKDIGKTQCSLSKLQKQYLIDLEDAGYAAEWAAGFEAAKVIIEDYLAER